MKRNDFIRNILLGCAATLLPKILMPQEMPKLSIIEIADKAWANRHNIPNVEFEDVISWIRFRHIEKLDSKTGKYFIDIKIE